MSSDTTQTRTPADWAAMFAAFENDLRQWVARVAELASEPEPHSASAMPSEIFEQRLEGLQSYLDRAEQNADQALAPLTVEIQAFEQWLQALNTARGTLVERTAGGV